MPAIVAPSAGATVTAAINGVEGAGEVEPDAGSGDVVLVPPVAVVEGVPAAGVEVVP
jgi:hypothetical protein